MSLADNAIENAAAELCLAKKEEHKDDLEWQKMALEAVFNQAIRLHCYAKGLEFAADNKS